MVTCTQQVFNKYLFNKLINYKQKETYGMMLPKMLTMVALGQWNLNFFFKKAFLKKQFILNWEAKVFKAVCIYYNECDLFIYLENASYFYFLKNSILSKNTFYPFKGRLETSLLWDLILVCERIQKSNFWASTRVSLYKAWRTDSIKTPWGNLSDCTSLLLGAGLLSLS